MDPSVMPTVVPEGCVSAVKQTIGKVSERGLQSEMEWHAGATLPITMVGEIMLLVDISKMYGGEANLPAFPGEKIKPTQPKST